MASTTPKFGWPIPVLDDPPNVPADMQKLATGIENTLAQNWRTGGSGGERGWWAKHDSGLQFCWVNTTIQGTLSMVYTIAPASYQGLWTWYFPTVFSTPPTVTCAQFKYGSGASWGQVDRATASQAVLRGIDLANRTSTDQLSIMASAIGFWK